MTAAFACVWLVSAPVGINVVPWCRWSACTHHREVAKTGAPSSRAWGTRMSGGRGTPMRKRQPDGDLPAPLWMLEATFRGRQCIRRVVIMCGELPGDVTARDFESYVTAQWRPLLRAGWLLTGNWAAAEDLVQSVLAQVWGSWPRVCAAAERDAYVRRMLTNQFLGQQRRRSSTELPSGVVPESSTADASADVHRRLVLTQALGELPPRQRAAVVLRYFEDLSLEQTAAALGCSVGTAKSQTSRALAKLRRSVHLDALLQEDH
jgi:RNA polymerase sigma-70 factor (sigma-E family)